MEQTTSWSLRRPMRAVGAVAVAGAALGVAMSTTGPARASGPVVAVGALGPYGVTTGGASMASGRVQDVAVDPSNPQHWLAVSDAALWVSQDAGVKWTLLPGLHRYAQWQFGGATLAFDPKEPGTVLLSAPRDDQLNTKRGIYRSTDGGSTWAPAANGRPSCAGAVLGVIALRNSNDIAAGDCAVGLSGDHGRTWSWQAPDASGGFTGVAWDIAGNAFACGRAGIFERVATAPRFWHRVVDFTAPSFAAFGSPTGDCRVIGSPAAANHIFFAAHWRQFQPDIANHPATEIFEAWGAAGGSAWHRVDLRGGHFENGRPVLIETRPAKTGFDLFWDNSDLDYFEHCTNATSQQCPIGKTDHQDPPNAPWTELGHGVPGLHADSTRILFTPKTHCILAISGDGGIQRPAINDCNGLTASTWGYTDSGISATEPYQMAVSQLTGSGSLDPDIHIATQDNGMFLLLSGSGTWTQADPGNDGQGIDATPLVPASDLASEQVYYSSDGTQVLANRDASALPTQTAMPFVAPWAGVDSSNGPTPGQLVELADGTLVIGVRGNNTSGHAELFTSSDGTTWTQISGSASTHLSGLNGTWGGVSLSADDTAAYVRTGALLFHVTDVTGNATEQVVLQNRLVGPYASGPGGRLIAFVCIVAAAGSCGESKVLYSTDYGATYNAVPVLPRMAQRDENGNTYQLIAPDAHPTEGQLTAFAIDPANPDVIVAGTRDTGLFQSSDAGNSWQRVGTVAPFITGLQFTAGHTLYFSSYGRGVFTYTPRPAQVKLQQIDKGTVTLFTATVTRFDGTPLAGATVTFRHLAANSGAITDLAKLTTDANGQATYSTSHRPAGSIIADVSKPGVPQIETQLRVA